jgi:uncharacterized paraquat-inducible protein A
MRIITISCPDCGTVVSGNELETERVMHCPGLRCDTVLAFRDLPIADQEYLAERRKQ